MRIVIDVDGVLANMESSVTDVVRGYYPDFDYEKDVKSWGFFELKENFPEAYEAVFRNLKDGSFIRNIPRNKGIESRLIELSKIGEVFIHTHMPFNEETYLARESWLDELKKDVGGCFDYKISRGDSKCVLAGSDVLIEDNLENIQKSMAPTKILIRKSYNEKASTDCLIAVNPFIVPDFIGASDILLQQHKR